MSYIKIAAAVFLGQFAFSWASSFVGAFDHARRWRMFFEYLFAAIAIAICLS